MKVLVAFASRTGCTREIAAEVARGLTECGAEAEAQPAGRVGDLTGYDAVVLGSAVRFGRILPEVRRFLTRFQPMLARLPVAAFAVGASLRTDTPERRQALLDTLTPVRAVAQPVAAAAFAGRVERRRVGLCWRPILAVARVPDGDWRDWDAIRAWAREVAAAVGISQ
jgi:menaquinone-dependent protoporphyrinogen oxidase